MSNSCTSKRLVCPQSRFWRRAQRMPAFRPSCRYVHGAASVTTALCRHPPNRPTLQRSFRIAAIRTFCSISNRASINGPNYQQISRGTYANVLIEGGIFAPSFLRPLKKDYFLCLNRPRWLAQTGLRRGHDRRQQRQYCAHLKS